MDADENGNVYVIWEDYRNGNGDIYFAKSINYGATFSTNIRVDDTGESTSNQGRPDIAVDKYGNLYAVWHDARKPGTDIYFSKSIDGGNTWSPNLYINSPNDYEQFPSIDVDKNNGYVYIAWTSEYSNSDGDIIFARSVDGGDSFETPVYVNDTLSTETHQNSCDIAVSGSGEIYVCWVDGRNKIDGYDDEDIYCAKSTNNGLSFGQDVKVSDDTENGYQINPSITVDASGNIYIAWRDSRRSSADDIYFAKSTNKGVSFDKNIRVDDAEKSSAKQWGAAIVADYYGNVFVTWQDTRESTLWDIYFTSSVDGGFSFNKNIKVNYADNEYSQWYPAIATDFANYIYIAWSGEIEGAGEADIYFARCKINSPPFLEFDIPATYNFNQDSNGGDDLIDLEYYFIDDFDDGNLYFKIVYEEEPSLLNAEVDGQFLDFEQVKPNWSGILRFQVEAFDSGLDNIFHTSDDMSGLSNVIYVTVNPEHDPPAIVKIGNQNVTGPTFTDYALEDYWYNRTINAIDPDGDVLFFSTNCTNSNFYFNETTAYISYLPTNDDVGTLFVRIIVTDNNGSDNFVDLKIIVENTNDNPYIHSIGNKIVGIDDIEFYADEDSWFYTTVEALDPDIEIGITSDFLTFGTNLSSIDYPDFIFMENGTILFHFEQKDVGILHVQVTVKDSFGIQIDDYVEMVIHIQPVNDNPIIEFIGGKPVIQNEILEFVGAEGAVEDCWYNLTVMASDEDGDRLIYNTNITLDKFNINSISGNISFLPDQQDVGVIFINISVADGNDGECFCWVKIEVINTNDPPPTPVIKLPEDNALLYDFTVNFIAQPISDPDGDVLFYYWDFDSSNGIQYDKTGLNVTHTFRKNGEYIITLLVDDNNGGVNSDNITITIFVPKVDDKQTNHDGFFGIGVIFDFIIIGAIIIIVILAIIVIFFKKSEATKEKEKERIHRDLEEVTDQSIIRKNY